MKRLLRVNLAALGLAGAVLCASPALAQDNTASAAPPPAGEVIGPPQLKDFSLNGTVTRRAEPAPERSQPRAPAPAPAPRSASTASPQRDSAAQAAQARAAPAPPASAERQTAASNRPSLEFGEPTPARVPPLAFPADALGAEPASSAQIGSFAAADSETGGGLAALVPWLIALLAAVGAAAWYFRRQRPGLALAGAGGNASAFDLSPAPEPAAKPRAPAPAPAFAPPDAPKGIVSTRLRPWLDIGFVPDFAEVSDEKAVIHFEVAVHNSGSAPARDLVIQAMLFNAGPDQDEAIGAFFGRPAANAEPIPPLPPMQRMSFRHSVTMTREQMRIFEVGGRRLFVPLIGFNAHYAWSSGKGQSSTSYLIGRDTDGEKMAPFRVDLGARTFRGLAAREHTVGVRS